MIRVFLIAASPLARAALQNRLKAPSLKIVGSAAAIDTLGVELSDAQADVLLVDSAGESPAATIESLADSELAAEIPIVVLTESAGPAASAQALQAGIVIGDILIALAGHPVARLEDVHSQLRGEAIGKPLALKFVRGGATQEVDIVVGERPRGGE